ncbi:hypothetical protein HU230_0011905 [Bradyrhizobium quebecense]|uniref:Uncharacterized protein n=1 Tax=Bradyrhizobium quebecense TaxID=2748629 RepID=A0A974AET0_9BRAD|nr:hypothetical protein [Bradyrhizobium quebecense]UGA46695.1 hypothetical protein HU230_0011905 [Bradyrhizobium quebecense]
MKLAIFIAASFVVGLLAGLRVGYRRGFEGGVRATERLYPPIRVDAQRTLRRA